MLPRLKEYPRGCGVQRAFSLIEQQNALQRFADDSGYKVVVWYVEGGGVELDETALSRLMDDVFSEGQEFNAVLVWNYLRLSRNAPELAELQRTLRERGIDLLSATESGLLDALNDEAAD